MKQYLNTFFVIFLCLSFLACAKSTIEESHYRDKEGDRLTKERFIPVELFTGGKWDGKHELVLKEVSTTACASAYVEGRARPCDNYYLKGPFKTEKNDTKIEWAGEHISYYKRTFSTRHMGEVESHFTINNSKDGLVRIYDKRKQWGARPYSGLGSKFPLGYWKQGEVRTYASRKPTRIEIIELDGPDHCLTFRWVIGKGEKKNMDNNYTYCPERGFTKISHNNASEQEFSKLPAKVDSLERLQSTVSNGVIKGYIPIHDPKFGNVWTNIDQDSLKKAGIKLGDNLCVVVNEDNITKLDTKLPYLESFEKVAVGDPLAYVNSQSNLSFALNKGNFSEKYHIGSGGEWSAQIKRCS